MAAKKLKGLRTDTRSLAAAFAEKYAAARGRDIGAVEVGIVDIYDSAVRLYEDILPRIAQLDDPTSEDLGCELVDLWMELQHIEYHARLAIRGIRKMEGVFRQAAEADTAPHRHSPDKPN